jgi:hypothetical protein
LKFLPTTNNEPLPNTGNRVATQESLRLKSRAACRRIQPEGEVLVESIMRTFGSNCPVWKSIGAGQKKNIFIVKFFEIIIELILNWRSQPYE